MSDNGFRVTGRFVLFTMIGFFAVIIAANTVFITVAVKSFPGEQEEKSYLQGLHYNDRIGARAEQAALGWQAEITEARLAGSDARIVLVFSDAQSGSLNGLSVEAALLRPASAENAGAVTIEAAGAGAYILTADAAAPGVWVLSGRATGAAQTPFEFEKRLVFE